MTVKTLNHEIAIGAFPRGEILPAQQRVAIAECAELAALVDRHTDSSRDGYHASAIDSLGSWIK
jgi:hypothetical protein